ncbi:MAG TPA: hypothetical protein VIH54_03180 [Chthoniobacterales bacterium]
MPKRFYRLEHRALTGSSERALEFGIVFTPLKENLVGNTSAAPKLDPALFEPLTRIENACRRASNIMFTAPNTALKGDELIAKDDSLEAFEVAVRSRRGDWI